MHDVLRTNVSLMSVQGGLILLAMGMNFSEGGKSNSSALFVRRVYLLVEIRVCAHAAHCAIMMDIRVLSS